MFSIFEIGSIDFLPGLHQYSYTHFRVGVRDGVRVGVRLRVGVEVEVRVGVKVQVEVGVQVGERIRLGLNWTLQKR